jgi:DNA polymerase III delta prime subunit
MHEIAQQFVPKLPKQENGVKGLIDRGLDWLSRGRNNQTDLADKTIPEVKVGKEVGTSGNAEELHQLLLDKVEMQIDLHRRAKELVAGMEIPGTEIDAEIYRMRNDLGTDDARLKQLQGDPSKVDKARKRQDYLDRTMAQWRKTNDDELRGVAEERLRRRKLRELKGFDHSPVKLDKPLGSGKPENPAVAEREITPEDITSGRVKMAKVMEQVAVLDVVPDKGKDDPKTDLLLTEGKKLLANVNQKIADKVKDPNVVGDYEQMRKKKVETLKKVREVAYGKKFLEEAELNQERLARKIFAEKRSFSPAEENVIRRQRAMAEAVKKRVDQLDTDPEVFRLDRWRTLREYQQDLKRDGFAETPSRRELVSKVRKMWAEGRNVLATGPTGTGKTRLFIHASKSMFGENPEIVTGHPGLTGYEVYGRPLGNGFESGPATKSVDRDLPFVFDEINAVDDNRTLMRLNTDVGLKMGDRLSVQEEGNGHEHIIGARHSWNATANVKGEKHPDRVELDDSINRRYEPLPVDYLPRHELYDMMLASLMDAKGGITLASRDDINALAELCQSTEWTQKAYQGYEIDMSNGNKLYQRGGEATKKIATLEKAVLDPGKALAMLQGWENARMSGVTLREHLNDKIKTFINNENFPVEDRYHLVRIFASNEFLKGLNVNDLMVDKLNQGTLDAWNGFNGKKIKAGEVYLTADKVAKLDPFGVVRQGGGELEEDLLGEGDTLEEADDSDVEEGSTLARLVGTGKREKNGGEDASSLISRIDQKYLESNYPKLSDEDRLVNLPQELLLAVMEDENNLRIALDRIDSSMRAIDKVEAERREPPKIFGRWFDVLDGLCEIAVKRKDKVALTKIGMLADQMNYYHVQAANPIEKPKFYPKAIDAWPSIVLKRFKEKLDEKIELVNLN